MVNNELHWCTWTVQRHLYRTRPLRSINSSLQPLHRHSKIHFNNRPSVQDDFSQNNLFSPRPNCALPTAPLSSHFLLTGCTNYSNTAATCRSLSATVAHSAFRPPVPRPSTSIRLRQRTKSDTTQCEAERTYKQNSIKIVTMAKANQAIASYHCRHDPVYWRTDSNRRYVKCLRLSFYIY